MHLTPISTRVDPDAFGKPILTLLRDWPLRPAPAPANAAQALHAAAIRTCAGLLSRGRNIPLMLTAFGPQGRQVVFDLPGLPASSSDQESFEGLFGVMVATAKSIYGYWVASEFTSNLGNHLVIVSSTRAAPSKLRKKVYAMLRAVDGTVADLIEAASVRVPDNVMFRPIFPPTRLANWEADYGLGWLPPDHPMGDAGLERL